MGLLISFGMGVFAGRSLYCIREKKVELSQTGGDEAFFKGVQYIISSDPDRAIEEFTKSVQINSDTIETYVALGNLFRSRGDIGRAIRIRQSIILRPHIDEKTKLKALLDMGLDYRKGGFLNRALGMFLEVTEKDSSNVTALKELEKIYEETKEWENAYEARHKIAQLEEGDHEHILAHHLVEMGKAFHEIGEYGKAVSLFNKAVSIYEECVDAYLHLGDLYFSKNEPKKAVLTWKKIVEIAPQFTYLAYQRLEGSYSRIKNLKLVEAFLKKCAQLHPDVFVYMALARFYYNKGDIENALIQINSALTVDPYFFWGRKFQGEILLNQGNKEDVLFAYRDLIRYLDVPYLDFRCSQCGFQPDELQWRCQQCKKWDTFQLASFQISHSGHTSQETDILSRLPKSTQKTE